VLLAQGQSGQLMKGAPLCFIENKGQVTDQDGSVRKDIDYKLSAAPGLNVFIGKGGLCYQFYKTPKTLPQEKRDLVPGLPLSICPKRDYCEKLEENTVTEYEMYRLDVELVGANANARVVAEELQGHYENYYTAAVNGAAARSYGKITYKNIYPNIDWVLYLKDNQLEYDFIVRPGGNVKNIKIRYDGATSLQAENNEMLAITPFGKIQEAGLISYQKEDCKKIASSFELQDNILQFDVDKYEGTLIIDPQLQWATYYGGSGTSDDRIRSDATGDIYITGSTPSITNIATSGAYQAVYGGGGDAYLAKFSSSGAITWATYYGGSAAEDSWDVALDKEGNIFIAGGTESTNNIATPGAYKTYLSGTSDAFIAKFSALGALIWATYYGGDGDDGATAIICDSAGNAYVTGNTLSSDSIATPGAYQSNGGNMFLSKFSSAGVLLWGTYYGGSGEETTNSITIDSMDNVYITGSTADTDSIATAGAYQSSYGGGEEDAFIAKFTSSGAILWATYYGGSGDDGSGGICSDQAGNIYIVGLTDSRDSIATPGAYQTVCNFGNPYNFSGDPDAFLAKFSDSGTIIWATYYGVNGITRARGVTADNLGNVYMAGTTTSTDSIATPGAYQYVYNGGGDAFIAEFSNAGALLWGTYFGGIEAEYGLDIAYDGMGNFYLLGTTNSAKGIATYNAYDTTFYGDTAYFIGPTGPDTGITTVTFIAKFDSMHADGVKEVSAPSGKISIYPSPAKDVVEVSWQGSGPFGVAHGDKMEVSILNMEGQELYKTAVAASLQHVAIPVSMLPAGVYVCVVQNAGGRWYGKFVKM